MGLEADEVLVYLDSWGLRRLFSLAIRRRSSARRRRDPMTDVFFGILVEHWGHYKKKKGAKGMDADQEELAAVKAVIDSEQDAKDLSGVCLDPYMVVVEDGKLEEAAVHEVPEVKSPAAVLNKVPVPEQVVIDLDDDGMDLDLEEQKVLEKIAMLR